jgi:hypothetical protein
MFNTAHLLRLFEFTREFDKTRHSNLEKVIKRPDQNEQLLTACLSSHRVPYPLRIAGFRWYRHPSDNWQLLR